ncbi:MOG interacting and ectopic P-granules protein 1 [Manduca sexta]|uniref:MOG interacting and ectopic P-granules protein 1 n=1 Tax=Manduca sexta TaxID=7130 RepID=UPI00188E4379|nr:MOG interacting and ectopic P-granules protein 1 [Manduca sexta]XP_030026776.2 MOG interacting and ectopic P-granules protein 1 [Manduca sexta]
MNGEVNGTMEDPLNAPSSPNDQPQDNIQFPENDANEAICTENSPNADSDINTTTPSSNVGCEANLESVEKNNDKSVHTEDWSNDGHTQNETEQENGDVENSCGSNDDSRSNCMDVLHTSTEKTNEHKIDESYDKIIENMEDEIDSEDDSSEEDASDGEHKAHDSVGIITDHEIDGCDESSHGSQKTKNDIIMLENDRMDNHNGNSHDSTSPEIQEIESDNEESTIKQVEKPDTKGDEKVQLRRSSRAIKRKRYIDDMENGTESDVEEIVYVDALRHKSKPIIINNTRSLVEMAAKQMKSNHSNNQKKEPTVVIIDTNSEKRPVNKVAGVTMSTSAHNLYQSIIARGTTVTPINSKNNTVNNVTPQPPSILPSLTDDMFVVEAPSFIVPYVYEKPSLKPFREFVDTLGKELDEIKAKEDIDTPTKEDKQKEENDKDDNTKQDKKEKAEGEPFEEDKGESEKLKKKAEKKERNQRKDEDDDVSWDGESSTDSDDDILSDEEDKITVIKDKADPIDNIKEVTELTSEQICQSKSDNYFDCSLGKFFIDIGYNLVQEYVQHDLLKQQNRKMHREKKSGHSTKATETSIASLMKNIELSKENNLPYSFTQKKCEYCSFKSESALVMSHHLETPHMKNNVYKCNFCSFEIRSPHDILFHMEAEHNIRGKLERAPAYHQCANCPFEDNGKGKLARHLIPCAKRFKPDLNLAPPIEWEPPAKIPKITKSRNSVMNPYQSSFNRGNLGPNLSRPMTVANMLPGVSSAYRPRGRSPMAIPPRAAPVHGTPIVRGGIMARHNSPVIPSSNYPTKQKVVHQPSISITPLPRQPQPVQPPPVQQSKSTFVICEICDGYIKDLEQLRNHMQWIHKVKIHPKMIYNRPPLNCQKCQFRFFTDQGLERHLLGSHGLVTSSMQEAANKGKDAGRCPVCGRVYQWKLLNHVARDHSLTLKPAHLSYKCTVCTATFGMYKQFENHVYSTHSVVAKRVMDKSKTCSSSAKTTANSDSLLKPLKINDEITIIPQPAKATATASKDK